MRHLWLHVVLALIVLLTENLLFASLVQLVFIAVQRIHLQFHVHQDLGLLRDRLVALQLHLVSISQPGPLNQ